MGEYTKFLDQRLLNVGKDIKNQEMYTVLLGLNVTEDNSLTMEQLPVTVTEGCTTNVYIQVYGGLNMLSRLIDICDEKIKPTLKDIRNIEILKQHVYKKRPNPTKNADSFFPKITVINGMEMARRDKELPAGYFQINGNEIVIDENYFSATNCRTMIHEFAHRLQWPWLECGVTNCVPFWNWDLCFKEACEIDADLKSLFCHPDKPFLLKQCNSSSSRPFPYLPHPYMYNILADHLRTKGHVIKPGFWTRVLIEIETKKYEEKFAEAVTKYKGTELEKTEQNQLVKAAKFIELKQKIGNASTDPFYTQEHCFIRAIATWCCHKKQ